MKRADKILSVARIDAGLAANGRINLRQQRRWHLHEVEPAPDACRRIAGEITDNAASQRYDEIIAFDLRLDQRITHALERREALGHFPWRHNDARSRDARRRELGFDGAEMR